MSAILLTTLGQAAGGPLGALTGSLIGSVADRALDAARDGGDIRALHASYGTIIPQLFGRNRTAGTIIWAQPMRRAGGGKGGGQRSYVMSLAVALSARRVIAVGRIWADGREIRGRDGKEEFPFVMRLASADATRVPDPLIAAIEGIDHAPGYRGLSTVVLEDFPLGPFGNRIPALEFEVISDPEDSNVGDWLVETGSARAAMVDEGPVRTLVGWPLVGAVLRNDLVGVARASGLQVGEQEGMLGLQRAGRLFLLDQGDVVMREGAPVMHRKRQGGVRAMSAAVSYADPERDYLEGEQQVFQPGSGEPLRMAVPMAMMADSALGLARAILEEGESAVEGISLRLAGRHLAIAVGDRIGFSGQAERWLVVGRTFENFELLLECTAWVEAEAAAAGDPGRANPQPVGDSTAFQVSALELPADIGPLSSQGIVVAVSARGDWPGADLFVDDGGQIWPAGHQRGPLIAGTLDTPLDAGPTSLWDEINKMEVTLDDGEAWLESRTAMAIFGGANLLYCAGELLQFRDAEPLGPGRFRLSGLLRGRSGSQPAAQGHAAGTAVWLIDPVQMRAHAMNADLVGRSVEVSAIGQNGTLVAGHVFAGLGHAPLSPCHVRAEQQPDGSVRMAWLLRDRSLFNWASDDAGLPPMWVNVEAWRDGTRVFVRRVPDRELVVSVSEQIAESGSPWVGVSVRVVAEGVGPEAFRASGLVPVR